MKEQLLSVSLERANVNESVINLVSMTEYQVNNILKALLGREMICSNSNFFSILIETFR